MLGKFLGKGQKSSLPKNQIEVVCPVCGAAQIEPRLVVTTHCRKCREHLRIVNGKVLASSKINPVPSAIFPAMDSSSAAPGSISKSPASNDASDDAAFPNALVPSEDTVSDPVPLGLGHMMGFKDHEDEAAARAKRLLNRPKAGPPSPRPSEPDAGEAQAAAGGTLQKMKDQGYYRQQYFKDVECFDCRNKFKTGRSARSTHCPACGALISLEDLEINTASTASIRTRGDVLIRKNGNVNASEIKCRDLKVQGLVSAQVECSGDVQMKTSGTVIGEIHCRRFVVERGSDIRFINSIYAEEVDIQARIEGNIQCTGRVTIGAQGWVRGDVTARSVSIEPGGQLDGAMNILRASTPKPAPGPSGPKRQP